MPLPYPKVKGHVDESMVAAGDVLAADLSWE